MKEISLTADDSLIEGAREKTRKNHTTLNQASRDWLQSYAQPEKAVAEFDALMERLSYVQAGRKFSRDEMNA